MLNKAPLWFCRAMWVVSLLVGLGLVLTYAWLPVDGATGDLESFTPAGFHVQWLLEERPGGLQVGDVIVRAGGYTFEEWLDGAPRGPEWDTGGVVTYELLRNGRPITLEIRMTPVSVWSILEHWWLQLLISFGLLCIGGYVFAKRSNETAACLLAFFCLMVSLSIWGDGYNFQYAILPRGAVFWFQFLVEYGSFVLIYASVLHFTLIFPTPHPVYERHPRLMLLAVYIFHPVVVGLATALAPSWSSALLVGASISWIVALMQALAGIIFGFLSIRRSSDPVSRAQMRWIVWGAWLALVIAIPGYILPLALSGKSPIPHPVVTLMASVILVVFAIPVLRYRLFDIEIVINRTLVYATLTALLGVFYLLLVRFLTLVVEILYRSTDTTLVVFLAAISIALTFNPLRQRVQTLIDRSFYRQKLDFQQMYAEMTERLATSLFPERLVGLLTGELPRRLQVDKACLLILASNGEIFEPLPQGDCPALRIDHPLIRAMQRLGRSLTRLQPYEDLSAEVLDWLESQGVELVIPLIVGEELVGLYQLGMRQSGKVFNSEEVHYLQLLGRQAAMGVQNSRLFQAEQEQRQLAEELARQVQMIMDTVPEGVVLLDGERRILLANPAAQEHLDVLTGEARPGQILCCLADEPIEALLEIDQEKPWREVTKQGYPNFVFEVAARPLAVEPQQAGWVLVLRDVTGEREIQAQVQMQQRLATVGQMAAGIAHDFNNIMAAILVYADMLVLDRSMSVTNRERIDIIRSQVQRAASLIRQILDFSRRSVMEMKTLDLLALIDETHELLQRVLPSSISLEVVCPFGEYWVRADAARLQQAFMNLSLNARDAMPAGGELRFELDHFVLAPGERPPFPDLTPGDWIRVAVSDSGNGIPTEILPRIFDPFFTTKPVGQGSGLGLAQVYGIVKQHGGHIDVQSREGEGTTFLIYLPRKAQEAVGGPNAEALKAMDATSATNALQ